MNVVIQPVDTVTGAAQSELSPSAVLGSSRAVVKNLAALSELQQAAAQNNGAADTQNGAASSGTANTAVSAAVAMAEMGWQIRRTAKEIHAQEVQAQAALLNKQADAEVRAAVQNLVGQVTGGALKIGGAVYKGFGAKQSDYDAHATTVYTVRGDVAHFGGDVIAGGLSGASSITTGEAKHLEAARLKAQAAADLSKALEDSALGLVQDARETARKIIASHHSTQLAIVGH